MAKSLLCKDCNTLLRDIKEAQSHNEVTGHANFEETTEVIKIMACTECGKPCRSQAEQDLHTKYTGHSTFVDKTNEASTLNTEQQMKEAKAEMEAEAADDAALLGIKAKASKPASSSGAAEAGGDGDAEMADMVPAEVPADMLKEMEEMGFGSNRCTRALHFTQCASIEAAINWLMEHEGDADLDEPLLVPKGAPERKKLSPEEARKAAEELMRKARDKREREERELELLREKERIRTGKELAAAKKLEEELALKRNLEQRQREKDEARLAREKIRLKLEEDRRERRRKLGLPEELSEEEKAKEAARLTQLYEEQEKKKLNLAVKPISLIERLRAKLVEIKKGHPGQEEQFKAACGIIIKYLGNIARSPQEDKFRSIKTSNAAFQSKVACLQGNIEFLEMCGFMRSDEALIMPKEAVDVEALNAAGGELNNAMTNPFFGAL